MLNIIINNLVGPNSAWFWTMAQAIGVIVTLILIYRQIVVGRHSAMLDALASLEGKWKETELVQARASICQNYLNPATKGDKSLDSASNTVLIFFEGLGLLLKLGVINKTVIWERLSYVVLYYWHLLEPKVKEFRAIENDSTFYDKYEEMADLMKKMEHKKTSKQSVRTDQELNSFASEEVALLTKIISSFEKSHVILDEMGAIEKSS